jgi:hypothetical protein
MWGYATKNVMLLWQRLVAHNELRIGLARLCAPVLRASVQQAFPARGAAAAAAHNQAFGRRLRSGRGICIKGGR